MSEAKILLIVTLILLGLMIWWYSWKIQLMYNSASASIYTPESFAIDPGHAKDLEQSFIKGREISRHKSIIFAGLLRDAASSVPSIRKKVERIGAEFRDYKVLIVENNSEDKTRELLLKWAQDNPRVTILGCGVNVPICDNISELTAKPTKGHSIYRGRIEKMVDLRNIYLRYIQSRNLQLYDYTVIWDFDVVGVTYLDGIFDTIHKLEKPENAELSAICAYGIYRWLGVLPLYYDTYAHLDHTDDFHIDNKLRHDISKGITAGISYVRGQPLVPVKSCFSGFTIYRTKDLLAPSVKYSMTPKNGTYSNLECEHVRLHSTLPGKIAMNPSMINLVLLNR